MRPISIVIPTLDRKAGKQAGEVAVVTAQCNAQYVVSHDSERQGFTKTVNDGIRASPQSDDICILNDDILTFHYGWLATLQRALYQRKNYGIAGPSGNSSTAPMCKGTLGLSGIEVVPQLPFWCVLVKRALINAIGLLDEAFIHYASDNWYCLQAKRRGWKCIWVKDVYLEHRQHGSGMQNEWKLHDQRLYRKRMGR